MRTIFGGIDGPISVSLFDLNDKGEAAFRAGIDLDTISIANLADELNEIASSNTARADKVQQYGNMIARFETLRGATFQVDNEKFQLLDFNVRGSDIAIYGQAVDKAGKLLTDANGNAIMGILGFAYNSTGKLVDTYGTVNGQAVGGADWAGTTVSVSSINDERYKQIVETTIVSGSALINTDENGDYSVLEAGGKIVTEIYTGSRPELQKAGDVTRIEGVVTKYGALDNLLGVVVIDSTGKQHIAESIQAGKDFYQLISSTDLTNEAAQRVINGIKYGFLSEAAVEDAGIKGIRILVKSTDGIDYFINTLKGGLISQVSADGLVHSGDQHAISLLFNELRDNQAWRLHLAEGRVQIGDGLTGLYEKIDKLGLKLDLVLAMDSEEIDGVTQTARRLMSWSGDGSEVKNIVVDYLGTAHDGSYSAVAEMFSQITTNDTFRFQLENNQIVNIDDLPDSLRELLTAGGETLNIITSSDVDKGIKRVMAIGTTGSANFLVFDDRGAYSMAVGDTAGVESKKFYDILLTNDEFRTALENNTVTEAALPNEVKALQSFHLTVDYGTVNGEAMRRIMAINGTENPIGHVVVDTRGIAHSGDENFAKVVFETLMKRPSITRNLENGLFSLSDFPELSGLKGQFIKEQSVFDGETWSNVLNCNGTTAIPAVVGGGRIHANCSRACERFLCGTYGPGLGCRDEASHC